MEELLAQILVELQDVNSYFDRLFTTLPVIAPVYTLDDIHQKIGEIGDQITGYGGGDLSDISHNVAMIQIQTDPA